jgi:hypothetical protein
VALLIFMKKLPILLLILLVIGACTNDGGLTAPKFEYSTEGKAALVIVVENSKNTNRDFQDIAFTSYKAEMISIFSDIFAVPEDSLANKTLDQILEQYGEPWQLESIRKEASDYYTKIISLTDSTANVPNLIDSLKLLNNLGYTVDMVFSLHGNAFGISFQQGDYPISKFTSELKEAGIKLRILYQTNCYSSYELGKWSDAELEACNGTTGQNLLTIFAPMNFVKAWTAGKSYKEAVEFAYNEELRILGTYNDRLPLLDYIINGNYILGSTPIFMGRNIYVTKDNYRPLPIN